MIGRLGRWAHLGETVSEGIGRHQKETLLLLLFIAAAARASLVTSAPTPYGYVYDYYHQGVQLFYDLGHLPASTDCWQCYHPPLYYVLAYPLWALGRWATGTRESGDLYADPALPYLAILPILCSLVIGWYAYRTIRFFRLGAFSRTAAFAVVLVFPCLFISFFAPEADIVLTAVLAPFLFFLVRYHSRGKRPTLKLAVGLGVLAGLAMATKYSGLVALAVAGEIIGLRLLRGPNRLRSLRDGAVILFLALSVGAWKYIDNYKKYGTPFFANGPAAQGFFLGRKNMHWDKYEFFSFRLGEVLKLSGPEAPQGTLDSFPVYRSVWTSLYAQGWSDMSFFSEPSRHGDGQGRYPQKRIPAWLYAAVLFLGLVPTGLGCLGFLAAGFRRLFQPFILMVVTTLGVYIQWVVSQQAWALKTKYILFLLPVFAIYSAVGLRKLRRLAAAWVYSLAVVLFIIAIGLTQAYLFFFALT
jgi:4-amino-4-deoxy-L-arabinose transferase-like glycosyltransferase